MFKIALAILSHLRHIKVTIYQLMLIYVRLCYILLYISLYRYRKICHQLEKRGYYTSEHTIGMVTISFLLSKFLTLFEKCFYIVDYLQTVVFQGRNLIFHIDIIVFQGRNLIFHIEIIVFQGRNLIFHIEIIVLSFNFSSLIFHYPSLNLSHPVYYLNCCHSSFKLEMLPKTVSISLQTWYQPSSTTSYQLIKAVSTILYH